MNEFEELLKQALPQEETFHKGKLVSGTVVKVDNRFVYVDIGYKVEGVIPREELPDVKEGDQVQAVIVRISPRLENPRLSYRIIAEQKGIETLQKAKEEGKDVVGTVEKRVRGGYIVDIEGVKAFLPSSEAGKKTTVGKPVRVKILSIDFQKGKPRVVVSHKAYVEEEREKRKQELLRELKKGDIVEGRVIKIDKNKGITLLIDGVLRAFLPKEELSWGRDRDPYNYAEVDEIIKVKVKKKSKNKDFLIVSLRELKENPWQKFFKSHKEGDTVEGKVVQSAGRGLIIDLGDDVEGYVPPNEISWDGSTPQKGETVKAKIIKLDPSKNKIELSIKKAQPKPWELFLEKHPAGTKVEGTVSKVEASRAIVDLEGGVKGIIHKGDISWIKPKSVADHLKEGEKREFMVLGQEGRFVKLGLKQLTPNPWEEVEKNYKVGDVVKLKVKEAVSFGYFLELPEGVDGLLPLSEVPKGTSLKEGDECEVKIIDMNTKDGKITFSIKALRGETKKEEEPVKVEEASGGGFKLGEILSKKFKM